jgi:hypothetical protein
MGSQAGDNSEAPLCQKSPAEIVTVRGIDDETEYSRNSERLKERNHMEGGDEARAHA